MYRLSGINYLPRTLDWGLIKISPNLDINCANGLGKTWSIVGRLTYLELIPYGALGMENL